MRRGQRQVADLGRRAWLRAGLVAAAALAGSRPANAGDGAPPVLAVAVDGGRSVQLLDGGTLEPVAVRPLAQPASALRPLPGRPRFVVLSEGGLLTLLDAGRAEVLAQAAPAAGALQLAVSSDGRWLLVAAPSPSPSLTLLDERLSTVRQWPLPAEAAWLADAAHRRSFVVALGGRGGVWEISYDERAQDFYEGLVHDFRMGEGVPVRGFHNARRMSLPEPLLAGCFDAQSTEIAGQGQVFNLDVRRVVARPVALQPPDPGAGWVFRHRQRLVMGVPSARAARVDWFRTGDWAHLGSLGLPAPSRWVRGHARWPAVVADAGGRLQVVDCERLQPTAEVPLPAAARAPALPASDGSRLWVLCSGGHLLAVDPASWGPVAERALSHPVAFASTGG